jgi:hypothetical protein
MTSNGSKSTYQPSPISDEDTWQTIVDFTELNDKGVSADDVLAASLIIH